MLKKIASNTISQVIAKVWTAIISIFLIKILTNYLSAEGYGFYSKIYNYLWIFAFLADLWLYTITIREISKNKENSEKIIWNVLTLRTILWVWIIFLAVIIWLFLPWYNTLLASISIVIVWLFSLLWLINSTMMSLMQSHLKVEFSVISTILWKLFNILSIAFIVFLLMPKESLNGDYFLPMILIFISWFLWASLMTFLNFLYANRIKKVRFRFDTDYIKHLFKISLPFGIALFLSVVYMKVDVIFLSIIESSSKSDLSVALYSVPMKILEVFMVVWTFFLNSMLTLFTKSFKEKNYEKLSELVGKSFKILFSMWVCFLTFWALFRDSIITIVANEDYIKWLWHTYTSSDAFLIVLFVMLFYFISSIYNYLLIATENQRKLLNINIFITLFNILWNVIAIPVFSFVWAWIVTVISQILLFILTRREFNKIHKISLPLLYIFKVLLTWISIFILWSYILNNYHINLYFDLFITGGLLFMLYIWFIYKFYIIK